MLNRQNRSNYPGHQPRLPSVMEKTVKKSVESYNPGNRGKIGEKNVEKKTTVKPPAMVNKPQNKKQKNLEILENQIIRDDANIRESKLEDETYRNNERNKSICNSIKRELSEWREKNRLSNRTRQKFAELVISDPIFESENPDDSPRHVEEPPPGVYHLLERHDEIDAEGGDKMMISQPVVKPEITKFADDVESLGVLLDAATWQRPPTPTVRSDTLKILENAHELYEDAKKILDQVAQQEYYRRDPRTLEEDPADEEDLYIKNIVSTKFDDASGKEISPESRLLTREQLILSKTYKALERLKRIKNENKAKKQVEQLDNKNLNKFEIKNCPQINIRNKLSMVSVDKHDIMPDVNQLFECKNIKTYEFKHESCDKKIEEGLATIDAAVQTSLRDLSTNSVNFYEPIFTDPTRSGPDLDQNNANQLNCPRVNEEAQARVNEEAVTIKPITFIDFLSQINEDAPEVEESSSKLPSPGRNLRQAFSRSPGSFWASEESYINIELLPYVELESFDQYLSELDEKIKTISKTVDNLKNFQSRKDKLEEVEKDNDEVEIFLRPRAMSSSSSCLSSEVIHPPNKFSTPLIHSERVSHPANSNNHVENTKNTLHNLNNCSSEPVVAPTSTRTSEKTFWSWPNVKCQSTLNNKIIKNPVDTNVLLIDNNGKSSESSLSFPTYTSEKSLEQQRSRALNTLEMLRVSCSKNKKTQSISLNKKSHVVHEDKVDKTACQQEIKATHSTNKLNENKNSKCLDVSGRTRSTNVTGESSVRDRTSYDVSGLNSESLTKISPQQSQQKVVPEKLDKEAEKIVAIDSDKIDNIDASFVGLVVPVAKLTESCSKTRDCSISDGKKSSNLIDNCCLTQMRSKNQENHDDKNCASSSSSTSSSLSRKIHRINRKFLTEDYSEGELCLPSSSSYSLGEIRVLERL